MARFFIKFDGAEDSEREADYTSLEDARNAAIMLLGGYLQEHPEFAYQQHWRVEIRDHAHRLLSHVVVATVTAAPIINWESFDKKPSSYRKDGAPSRD